MRKVKLQDREFLHVGGGWCVRRLELGSHPWRVYYTPVVGRSGRPTRPKAVREGGEPVGFDSRSEAVAYVRRVGGLDGPPG